MRIIGYGAALLLAFLSGIVVAAILHIGSPIVTVKVHNISGKDIASLQLSHEHGSVEITNIPKDQHRTLRFYAPGESSYTMALVFSDGQSLEEHETYVEAGYEMTETITEREINTRHSIVKYW